jgi:FKBP-type peptidyl-prolyl cis-trans isomerase FklB
LGGPDAAEERQIMKGIMNLQKVAAMGLGLVALNLQAENSIIKDQKDKVSYSIGVNIGTSFKQQGIDVNPEALIAGFKDALSGGKAVLTQEEVSHTLAALQRELMTKQVEQARLLADKNKKDSEVFFADNRKKEGIKTTASGLQYKVITEGKGKRPMATDTVRVHYRGTLLDGSEFDSSYQHSEPAEFSVAGVIRGWTEAVQLMPVGSKWQLFVPPNLAYGEEGQGSVIGPNAALIFEVELLSVVDPAKQGK